MHPSKTYRLCSLLHKQRKEMNNEERGATATLHTNEHNNYRLEPAQTTQIINKFRHITYLGPYTEQSIPNNPPPP